MYYIEKILALLVFSGVSFISFTYFFLSLSFLFILFAVVVYVFFTFLFQTRYTDVEFDNENKNTGILSKNISLNKTLSLIPAAY